MKNKTPLLLSLDYELFFGRDSGSIDNCLLKPTEEILRIVERNNTKICLFVDAGFLIKLKQYSSDYPELQQAYYKIKQQLLTLSGHGHDVQLHIHPHWQDSYYDGSRWIIDTRRYRLHDFSAAEVSQIIASYKAELKTCCHNDIFAYRAGGWCLQPFSHLLSALKENGIWLDSTVYSGGLSDDPSRHFNFINAPQQDHWRFDENPLTIDENGFFVEVPITTMKTPARFFWKLAMLKLLTNKLLKNNYHQPFGDGSAMIAHGKYYLTRLFTSTYGPVMIDGMKAAMLNSAFNRQQKIALTNSHKNAIFNVMGHPKSVSPYSLSKLDEFLTNNKNILSITYQDLIHLQPQNLTAANKATINNKG